jgi:toxic protein SymE
VGYVSDAKYQPLPAIILKGHWLEQVGFETGTPLEVRVLPDCLILTVKPPPEPEVIKALRKACKLPARKQRQIAEFIEVIAGPQKRTAKA